MVVCRRSIDLASIQIKFVAISNLYLLYTRRQAYKFNILFNFVTLYFFCFCVSSLRTLSPFFLYFNQMFDFDGR